MASASASQSEVEETMVAATAAEEGTETAAAVDNTEEGEISHGQSAIEDEEEGEEREYSSPLALRKRYGCRVIKIIRVTMNNMK